MAKEIEKIGSKTFYKLAYGSTASITEHRNGTATLKICDYLGRTVQRTTHKSFNGARISLGKYESWGKKYELRKDIRNKT